MAAEKKSVHPEFAERILKSLPAKLREESEVVLKEGKPYSIIKVRGKSLASVRDGAIRIVHPHTATADDAKAFARMLAEAAPEAKPEPKKAAAKPKAEDAKPEGDAGAGEAK